MCLEVVDLQPQLPVLGGGEIKVLIHREGVGPKAVVARADRQVGDGRIVVEGAVRIPHTGIN